MTVNLGSLTTSQYMLLLFSSWHSKQNVIDMCCMCTLATDPNECLHGFKAQLCKEGSWHPKAGLPWVPDEGERGVNNHRREPDKGQLFLSGTGSS